MDIILFLTSFALILAGCELFTNGIEWIGKRFRFSEGAVGSVLAAVGTAMPETLLPMIAILFGGASGKDIGVGAILGAPFMLSTIAIFVCGVSVLVFIRRRGTRKLHLNGKLIRRDLRFFLIAYTLAAVAALLPGSMGWFKTILGVTLIPLYGVYALLTLSRREGVCNSEDLKCLYFQRVANGLKGNGQECPDVPGERLRKVIYQGEPQTYLIVAQAAMGLAAIILGANLFVQQVHLVAEAIGMPALILSLVLAPIATELPEKFNSVLWIRCRKDTYAIGNITGAMVFQSSVVVTIGILMTDWHIALSDETQFLQACAIGIALLSGSLLYLRSGRNELGLSALLIGGAFYLAFMLLMLFGL